MTGGSGTVVLVAFVLSMLIAVGIVLGYNRIRQGGRRTNGVKQRAGQGTGSANERQASAPAEFIQAIVRREMSADPALAGRSIDFGTAPDGSLEIWLDDRSYSGVDQIPDVRLREIITRAADEFNRNGPAVS
jgi:hypothetical protein